MKKRLFFLFGFLFILLVVFYFLIPSQSQISRVVGISANANAVYRNMLVDESWTKWWPKGDQPITADNLSYGDVVYKLDQKLFNAFAITVRKDNWKLATEMNLLPLDADSIKIVWNAQMTQGGGAFAKIKNYFQSKTIAKQMDELLYHLKYYLEDTQNLYGSVITQTKVKDTVLVATRLTTDHYPTTEEIYNMVDKLKDYIQQAGARERDFPMLHVDSSKGIYTSMVGIPTDTLVNGNNIDVDLKRLVLGNILMTEVKGGTHTTRNALRQLEHYVYDHSRTSPAIPYESLVTDRRKERDTSKWITRIFYPVF